MRLEHVPRADRGCHRRAGRAPCVQRTITLAAYTETSYSDVFKSVDVTDVFGAAHTGLAGTDFRPVFRIDNTLPGSFPFIGMLTPCVYGN